MVASANASNQNISEGTQAQAQPTISQALELDKFLRHLRPEWMQHTRCEVRRKLLLVGIGDMNSLIFADGVAVNHELVQLGEKRLNTKTWAAIYKFRPFFEAVDYIATKQSVGTRFPPGDRLKLPDVVLSQVQRNRPKSRSESSSRPQSEMSTKSLPQIPSSSSSARGISILPSIDEQLPIEEQAIPVSKQSSRCTSIVHSPRAKLSLFHGTSHRRNQSRQTQHHLPRLEQRASGHKVAEHARKSRKTVSCAKELLSGETAATAGLVGSRKSLAAQAAQAATADIESGSSSVPMSRSTKFSRQSAVFKNTFDKRRILYKWWSIAFSTEYDPAYDDDVEDEESQTRLCNVMTQILESHGSNGKLSAEDSAKLRLMPPMVALRQALAMLYGSVRGARHVMRAILWHRHPGRLEMSLNDLRWILPKIGIQVKEITMLRDEQQLFTIFDGDLNKKISLQEFVGTPESLERDFRSTSENWLLYARAATSAVKGMSRRNPHWLRDPQSDIAQQAENIQLEQEELPRVRSRLQYDKATHDDFRKAAAACSKDDVLSEQVNSSIRRRDQTEINNKVQSIRHRINDMARVRSELAHLRAKLGCATQQELVAPDGKRVSRMSLEECVDGVKKQMDDQRQGTKEREERQKKVAERNEAAAKLRESISTKAVRGGKVCKGFVRQKTAKA